MPDANVEIMIKLFSKIAGVMSVGSNEPYPGHSFLMLHNPGFFPDPDADFANNVDEQYLLADEFNRIPYSNWIWEDSGALAHDLFKQIIDDKELATEELSDTEKAQLREARAEIENPITGLPTRKMKRYDEYMEKYWDALESLENARWDNRNSGRPIPQRLIDREAYAMRQWVSRGFKQEIETAISKIWNLQSWDPNNWWTELMDKYRNNERNNSQGQDYLFTQFNPAYSDWFSDEGWTTFTFGEDDIIHQSESKSVRIGGGLSLNFGLWRSSASSTYAKDQGFSRFESKTFKIEAQIKRVNLVRNWLNPLVFQTRNWRWRKGSNSYGTVISNGGDPTQGITPDGLMPFYPTGILIARNFTLQSSFSDSETTFLREKITARGGIGFGPFSIGGRYSKETSKDYAEAHVSSNQVSNPSVQVLGRFCSVLGKCPNYDPTLTWPSDSVLLDDPEHSNEYKQERQAARKAKGLMSRPAVGAKE